MPSTTIDAATTTPERRKREVSRRRFLQSALAVGGVAALDPKFFGDAAYAGPPLGPNDRILVLIEMSGGNDGLNTLIPTNNGSYNSLRGGLAIPAASTHNVGDGLGLHPSLAYLKSRYDGGDLAIVRGVGHGEKDHSHFSCMAKVMAGTNGGIPTSGFLGRWLDGLGMDGFAGINIGNGGVPLVLKGAQAEVTGLPTYGGLFGSRTESHEVLAYDALVNLGNDNVGFGTWGNEVADTYQAAISSARRVNPIYSPAINGNNGVARDLTLAARLINLDLGARTITVSQGGYDTHSDQLPGHATLLSRLDGGIQAFFATLAPQFRDRVVVMTYSEFGRRVRPSDSAGTDHGTASVLFLVGNLVRGGLHGAQPSLTQLDNRGDLNISVDVRSVFASVLSRWLQADDRQVLGADWSELDLFVSAGSGGGAGGPGPSGESGGLGTMTPVRIVDTRSGVGLGRTVKLGPGERVDIPVAGRDGVPALGVGAAVMNVTVTQCDATGFLTVWPTGEPMPDASSLNFVADQSVPNLVIAKLGAAGHVSVYNSNGNTHLIVDVSGWFPADQAFVSLTPSRILDTRIGNGAPQAKVGPGAVVDLQVLGRGGVPNAGNVGAVAMNVTVDGPDSESFVTVWPKGEGLPDASNLNMRAGQTVPNLVVAKVGADGQVSLRNAFGSTDLIADVLGWFPTGVGLQALTPSRILDTRNGNGAPAVPLGPQQVLELQVAARGGVPANATAVVMNVTATDADALGFVTVWPAGVGRPDASNLNTVPGRTSPNLVIARLGTDGKVDLYNSAGTVNLIADVMGYFV
jgi:uncharacterized protein (DUF1501 family)